MPPRTGAQPIATSIAPRSITPPSDAATRAPATLESPAAVDEIDAVPADERTDPNMAAAAGDNGTPAHDGFEDIPTRQSHLSEAMASTTAPHAAANWDEPTRERLDVVREFLSAPPPPEPASYTRIPSPVQHENSIIVDDDIALTEPVAGDELRALRSEANRIETFLSEMTVLIKYGHASQVPREIERWVRANPEDLSSQLRLAEFERSRIDATQGLDRLFWLASRALDRGDRGIALRILEVVQREAPNDLRRAALQDRVGVR